MFMYLIHCDKATDVVLEFLVPGHSYMRCDQGFATLETKFRTFEMISCPQQYATLIKTIKSSLHVNMGQEDIYDWKDIFLYIQHRTAKKPVMFQKAHTITLTRSQPWMMFVEAPEGSQYVNLARHGETRLLPEIMTEIVGSHDLKLKYRQGLHLRLPPGKTEHLQKMKPFLDAAGRIWAQSVIEEQDTAVERPRTAKGIERKEHVYENDMDEDFIDEYEAPIPVETDPNLPPMDDSGNEYEPGELEDEPEPRVIVSESEDE